LGRAIDPRRDQQSLDGATTWRRRLGTLSGHGKSGSGIRETNGVVQHSTFGKCRGDSAIEDIPSRGGIDGFDREAGHASRAVGRHDKGSLRAERDDDRRHAARTQVVCCRLSVRFIGDADPGQ